MRIRKKNESIEKLRAILKTNQSIMKDVTNTVNQQTNNNFIGPSSAASSKMNSSTPNSSRIANRVISKTPGKIITSNADITKYSADELDASKYFADEDSGDNTQDIN